MKILVAGSHGFIGSSLIPFLQERGHTVIRLVRKRSQLKENAIFWNPESGELERSQLENVDAVINLAGESIMSGRWTEEKKRRLKESRIQSTKLLAQTLVELNKPPRVLINCSAIGYYGNRGDAPLTETAPAGQGFLAEACQEWEAAAKPVLSRGIRLVLPRLGIVLSPQGGALQKMLIPFKLGLGGKLGSGKQYMSWVDLRDVIRIFYFALSQERLQGAVNVVSPNSIQNEKFTEILASVLKRPAFLTTPEWVLRMVLGQAADELLLSSAKVIPKALQDIGFEFHYPHLKEALQMMLLEKK